MSLTDSKYWTQLQEHYQQLQNTRISNLFDDDRNRSQHFSLDAASLLMDYSKTLLTHESRRLLIGIANNSGLGTAIEELFTGKQVNNTEQRPALHTALRAKELSHLPLVINQTIEVTRLRIDNFVRAIHSRQWRGYTGKPITDIVNIGIGGSHLGPAMANTALSCYRYSANVNCHFVSNIDGSDIHDTLAKLFPDTTLFIIASKSFSTLETLKNATIARQWLLERFQDDCAIARHTIAVTANINKAIEFGINEEQIYPMWDWVGGRYSLWSAIGLPVVLSIGIDNFKQLLQGAEAMDQHFRTAPFENNMPIMLGLLGIWHSNICQLHCQAILPYDHYLRLLPAYLQQLEMESNGKSTSRAGEQLAYQTSPVLWGDVGTNGQHSFHQLLHQGSLNSAVDFILTAKPKHQVGDHHQHLLANGLSQSQALMLGKSYEDVYSELQQQELSQEDIDKLAPHKVIPGNRPSNTIILPELTPYTLGALIALYEHKVFVQGVIWNINSFDQWGVELGKQLSSKIYDALTGDNSSDELDQSTRDLIKHIQQLTIND